MNIDEIDQTFSYFYPGRDEGLGVCNPGNCTDDIKEKILNVMKKACNINGVDDEGCKTKLTEYMNNYVNNNGCWPSAEWQAKPIPKICNNPPPPPPNPKTPSPKTPSPINPPITPSSNKSYIFIIFILLIIFFTSIYFLMKSFRKSKNLKN